MEGLLWGQCQRIPIAFGIKKLRMLSVVVDDLVSTDALQEQIDEMDGVQSSDIHAFNKI
jgi:elongation factor 1-beta